jgi:hypothetical protein
VYGQDADGVAAAGSSTYRDLMPPASDADDPSVMGGWGAAGGSARRDEHELRAAGLHEQANQAAAAARTEPLVAELLAGLQRYGYHSVADRSLPGHNKANIDALVVGPSGVYVVDAKCWAAPRVDAGSLWNGQELRDDELDSVEAVARRLSDCLEFLGPEVPAVVPVLCFCGPTAPHQEQLETVQLTTLDTLGPRILQREQVLSARGVEAIFTALLSALPPAGEAEAAPWVDVLPVLPKAPAAEARSDEQPGLFDVDALGLGELQRALGLPVEDWMLFLDREQRRLVHRQLNGPGRIRGAAGTGKTAIGLHRAAWIAENSTGPLLFTTFVKTLPPVLRTSYAKLSPRTTARVEFLHVHGWAAQYLRRKGIRLDPSGGKAAFDHAWETRPAEHFGNLSKQYVHDEIDHVIKGRGLTTLQEYLGLERHGRRLALNADARKAIWRLVEVYNYCLSRSRTSDYNDLLSWALQTLDQDPHPPSYTAVICDEVQDVNLLGIRLLHRLVGDAPNGLLLVGDGQQAIYPGGFTLAEAGVDVVGRSTVLRGNYRNTAEIMQYAGGIVGAEFTDLDTTPDHHDTELPARHGLTPAQNSYLSLEAHDRALLDAVRAALNGPGVNAGDLALVAVNPRLVTPYVNLLRRNGIPAVDVAFHNGSESAQVRVATAKRVKGMEFKHVFCVRVDPGSLPLAPGPYEVQDAHVERLELLRRELFVAMTRARDTLWIGSVGPSAVPLLRRPLPD